MRNVATGIVLFSLAVYLFFCLPVSRLPAFDEIKMHIYHRGNRTRTMLGKGVNKAVFVRFSLGGSEFRLAMTDRATIAGMEVAKLVPWNSLLN